MRDWNFTLLFCLLIAGLVLGGCNKEAVGFDQEYEYLQTYCADPWGHSRDEDEARDLVTDYFEKEGIEVAKVEVNVRHKGELCLACTCKSGVVISLEAPEASSQALRNLGFVKI